MRQLLDGTERGPSSARASRAPLHRPAGPHNVQMGKRTGGGRSEARTSPLPPLLRGGVRVRETERGPPPFTFQRRQRGTLPPKYFLSPDGDRGEGERGERRRRRQRSQPQPRRAHSLLSGQRFGPTLRPVSRLFRRCHWLQPLPRTREGDQSLSPLPPPPQDFSPTAQEAVREERGKRIDNPSSPQKNSLPREQGGV